MRYQEVPGFVAKLREREAVAALGLEFTILTAARSGETLGARWSEIDLNAKVWTIPAERMKAAREHRVPLSEPALAILGKVALQRASSTSPCYVGLIAMAEQRLRERRALGRGVGGQGLPQSR